MKRPTLILLVLLLICSTVFGDELTSGYKSFSENNLKQAYVHFQAATLQSDTKAEAFLMLSLMASVDKSQTEAFNYFIEFCKSSPNPDPYITALNHHNIFNRFESQKSKEQVNWYLQLLKRTNLPTTLQAYLNEDLGKHFESLNDLKKSREYFAKIGAVMEWQIAGDFENISASGFDKNPGPLDHPEPEAVFKNKMDADIKWFDLYKQIPGKWVDLTYNFYCNNSIVYAQTFCNTPEDKNVVLRIGTSGSLKVWVNDQMLFAEKEERNNGIDNYNIPVKLFKGNNRILLQIGCSKIEQCNFMLRVTDPAGNILSTLPFTKVYTPYNKTNQPIPVLEILPAETYLLSQIEKYPEKLVNYLVLANTYLSNDKTSDAKNILLKAIEKAPDCTALLFQLYELHLRDQDRTSTSIISEKLKSNDPDNPTVLNIKINEAFDGENYKDARELVDRKEQLYGQNKESLLFRLRLAGKETNVAEYENILKKLTDLFPGDYDVISQKYQYEKGYKKDQKAAIKTLKDYSKNYFDKTAMQKLSNEYFQAGMIKEGVEALQNLSTYYPFNDSYYKQLGSFFLQNGNSELAEQYMKECLTIAPYYGPYHGIYAQILAAQHLKDKAIAEYQKNIEYRPDDYNAIKKLRDLKSEKELFDYFPEKDYYAMYKNSPTVTDYPSDNILSLNEESQVVLLENGGCEMRQILLLKALTLKGIDNLKEYTVDCASNESYTIEKAEVLKKNGNRLQAEVNKNQIVYTSLEPGDGVFLIYKKYKDISGKMAKNFTEKMLLNTWYPCLNIEYNLLVDKRVSFNYMVEHSDLKPQIVDQGNFNLYTWRKTNNKALKTESYMPEMVDVNELLSISTIPDWDYYSKWYYDISNTKTAPEGEVIEKVNELLNDKKGLNQKQTARILYNFIEQNIRYSSVPFRQNGIVPQKASDVLITRIGDCKDLAVLFTSMCKAAGIDAKIVLVMRRENGTKWLTLPSFDFDHAIAKATLDGKDYYIELTSSDYPFATLGDGLLGSAILEISNDPTRKESIKILDAPTRQPNNIDRIATASFSEDNMTCSVKTTCLGSVAATKRSLNRDLKQEEREESFVKSLTEDYPNIKLLQLNFESSLYDNSDTMRYQYSFSAPKVFTKINDIYIVKLPLTNGLVPLDFLSPENRLYPIELWQYISGDTISEHLSIEFPKSKKLMEMPKDVNVSCSQADYSLKFSVSGNNLNVTRIMICKKDYVPVADYMDYRKFMEEVVNADNQKIAFK